MTINPELLAAYRWHKQQPHDWRLKEFGRAFAALCKARADIAEGRRRYPSTGGNGLGAPDDNGHRWCENPGAIGLRFVGFADKIAARAVTHTGWFIDGFQEETYRGAVYQLPARGGRPIYVPGYREGTYSHRDRVWHDMSGTESALLDLRYPLSGARGGVWQYGASDDDTARDTAIYADGMADRAAESARDYSEAWQAGASYAELADELSEARKQALQLIAERKAICRQFGNMARELRPATAAAIDRAISDIVNTISELKQKREELRDEWTPTTHERATGWRAPLYGAFAEGAGLRLQGN